MQVKPIVLALAGLLANGAHADTPAFQIDEVVVTATRIAQPISHTGSSVRVLSADELLERGVRFVADALMEIPSLSVSSQGPRGSLTQVRVRGNEANHVLVLIDGMRVGNASTGEFDFANLGLEGVDKIEVLLGPQSTLYGSDAMAGVISITTRKGGDGFAGDVRAGVGSLSTRTGSARISGGRQGWNYSITANRYLTDGISAASEAKGNSERDGYDTRSANLKFGYDHERFQTWVVYNYDKSRYDFDAEDYMTGLAIDEPANRQRSKTDGLSWNLAVPLFDGRMSNRLQVSKTQNDQDIYSVFFGSGSTYVTETDRVVVEYQGSYKINDRHALQFGAERAKEKLLAVGDYSYFDKEAVLAGTYLQWLTTLGRLDLSLGTRWDDHDDFGLHNTYRVTANYRIDDALRLHAAYGTGFKAPSLQELYDTSYGGNPDLRPEETVSGELGLEYRTRKHHAGITVFDQDTDNLIRYVGPYPSGVNQNIDQASSRGVEVNAGTVLGDWQLDANLAWVDADETRAGVTRSRLRVPEWSGSLLASYYMASGRLWAQALYRGDRRDTNFVTGDVTLKGYWLFNAGASFELATNLTLTARIDNLADKRYEEVYSYGAPGRTGMVTVDWRF
ncbi:MAG: TonB-dependent receptor [Thiobacillus sp.]|nr:TonB-dependent receptor [Thiobacillus sp.]